MIVTRIRPPGARRQAGDPDARDVERALAREAHAVALTPRRWTPPVRFATGAL